MRDYRFFVLGREPCEIHSFCKTTGTYTGTVYEPLLLKKAEGSHLFFENVYQLDYAGGMKFGLRMYPQNELLPHRMDFCYVRWL